MLTAENLLIERTHPGGLGGVQRIYRFKNGAGLSLVNSPKLRGYPFAWEAAVLKGVADSGDFESLDYGSGLTDDVEVFMNDERANAFIERAAAHFSNSVD